MRYSTGTVPGTLAGTTAGVPSRYPTSRYLYDFFTRTSTVGTIAPRCFTVLPVVLFFMVCGTVVQYRTW